MFKLLKLSVILAGLAVLIMSGFYLYFNFIDKTSAYSEVQAETIKTLGNPEQFAITYLPNGEDEDNRLIRQDTWFYPSLNKKFSFLGGGLTGTKDLDIPSGTVYTKTALEPGNFDIYTTLDDVKLMVGEVNLAAVDVPAFYGEGIESYASKEAVFIFDQGYLTYMETID